MTKGIIINDASATGKTTLAKELAKLPHFVMSGSIGSILWDLVNPLPGLAFRWVKTNFRKRSVDCGAIFGNVIHKIVLAFSIAYGKQENTGQNHVSRVVRGLHADLFRMKICLKY